MSKRTPFSVATVEDRELATSNASALTDAQKASVPSSNNVNIATAPGEKLITGPDNTLISLCRDRPGEIGTGPQYTSAGAIYLCAGASYGLPDKTPKGESGELLKAQRNFNIDASTIYMSAKCDIDDYFGLTSGGIGRAENSAAIAIKSTNIRLISRQGIKIITRTDPTNENLAPLNTSITGIELIAGNDDSDLQGIVKADNMSNALFDLSERVYKIAETLEFFLQQQSDFNSVLASHTHPDLLNICIGTITSGKPLSFANGSVEESLPVKIQGEKTNAFIVGQMLPDISKHKLNIENFLEQYCKPSGPDYIGSRYNRTN